MGRIATPEELVSARADRLERGRLRIDEPRIHRNFALPLSAFDALKNLQRAWGVETNAEVVTRLLLEADAEMVNDARSATNDLR